MRIKQLLLFSCFWPQCTWENFCFMPLRFFVTCCTVANCALPCGWNQGNNFAFFLHISGHVGGGVVELHPMSRHISFLGKQLLLRGERPLPKSIENCMCNMHNQPVLCLTFCCQYESLKAVCTFKIGLSFRKNNLVHTQSCWACDIFLTGAMVWINLCSKFRKGVVLWFCILWSTGRA